MNRNRLHLLLAAFVPLTVVFAQDPAPVETKKPPAIEGTIAVSAGSAFVNGDPGAFQERLQRPAKTIFGGLEDLHYRRDTSETTLVVSGHALAGEGDYGLTGHWARNEHVYVDLGYNQFRTFYDGSGGYFPPSGAFVPLYDDRLHIDRGHLWLEVGLTPEDMPHFVLRYERLTRSGTKPSTELGETNLTGGAGSKSIVPSFIDVDETHHIITFDAGRETPRYQWEAGVRYEHTEIDNTRQNRRRPNEAASRAVSSKDSTDLDLFSAHAFAERRFGKKFTVSAGGLAATLDTNLSGSRIYGNDYDPVFDPLFTRRQPFDLGFFNLRGGSQLKQYVGNLNAVYQASRYWTIRPSVRYEHLQLDNLSTFIATTVLPGNAPTALQSTASQTQKQENRFTEVLELRYTGHASWIFNGRAEWSQTAGDLNEFQFDQVTTATLIDRATHYRRRAQKYSLGAIWYARPKLSFSAEYYYRLRLNDYRSSRDSTPAGPLSLDRYPAFITDQDFATHDFNVRATWRPLSNVSLVSRYDFQLSTVRSGFVAIPQIESSRAKVHIVSQSVTWSPLTNLYIVGAANLTYDQMATPAAAYVRNADNNYFNASINAGYALGKSTDLYVDLTHYRARDFSDNSAISLPYGADQRIQTASMTCVFRQTPNTIYTLKYTYATNQDHTSGDHNDFTAHIVYAKAQYRF